MSWNANQVREFDIGLVYTAPFLRVNIEQVEFYLTSSRSIRMPDVMESVPAPASQLAGATPCILNWGEVSYGFDQSGDAVASMVVTATNAQIPLPLNLTYAPILGLLSDYLNLMTISGGNDTYSPPHVAIFYPRLRVDTEDERHYVFRGVINDFDVIGDGKVVVMRLVEDSRWNRQVPYRLSKDKFARMPQENAGLPFPMNYGVFGVESVKDWASSTSLGPWTNMSGAFFPSSMLLMPSYIVSARGGQTSTTIHSIHCHGLHNPPGYAIKTGSLVQGWDSFVIMGDGQGAIVPLCSRDHSSAGWRDKIRNETLPYTVSGDSSAELSNNGQSDTDEMNVASLVELSGDFKAYGLIFPVKEVATNNNGDTNNLSSLFSNAHHRERTKMTDGDRWTWFKDDTSSGATTQRRIMWELGAERNLGAIVGGSAPGVEIVVLGRVRAGTTGTVTFAAELDIGDTTSAGDTIVASGWTGTVGATDGYFRRSAYFPNLTTLCTQVERWEFVKSLDRATTNPGQGMILTFKWTRSAADIKIDIIQVALVIRFRPSRYFVDNRTRTFDYGTKPGYNVVSGEEDADAFVVKRTVLTRVLAQQEALTQRRNAVAGLGTSGYFFFDMPGDPAWTGADTSSQIVVHNPAEVARSIMLHYGGYRKLGQNIAWKTIDRPEFELNSGSPRDWKVAENALDLELRESIGNYDVSDTFKIAASIPSYNTVREAVRAVISSAPGLYVYRSPLRAAAETQIRRASWCCSYPRTGDPVTYRRRISLRNDTVQFSWQLTPQAAVVNDVKIRYGFATLKGTYQRLLQYSYENPRDHGWPKNTGVSGIAEDIVVDNLGYPAAGFPIRDIVSESYDWFGNRTREYEFPFIYRWQEALTIRNHILRWNALPRVRLFMVCNFTVSDLQPGDVFQLDAEADSYIGSGVGSATMGGGHNQWPLKLYSWTVPSWALATWLVERVTYAIGEKGELLTKVQAIFNGKMAEVASSPQGDG